MSISDRMNRDQKIKKHNHFHSYFLTVSELSPTVYIRFRFPSLSITNSTKKKRKNLKKISGLHHMNPSSLFLTTPSAVSFACLDLLQRSSYDSLWRIFVAITDLHLRPRRPTSDIGVDFLHYIGSFTSCTIERRMLYHICDVHRQTRHGFNGAKPSSLGQGPSSSRYQFSIHLEC